MSVSVCVSSFLSNYVRIFSILVTCLKLTIYVRFSPFLSFLVRLCHFLNISVCFCPFWSLCVCLCAFQSITVSVLNITGFVLIKTMFVLHKADINSVDTLTLSWSPSNVYEAKIDIFTFINIGLSKRSFRAQWSSVGPQGSRLASEALTEIW